uniref:Secreted protein n=1 Tax=Oncorhynchus mykiss TaxID=8022 RepID=A0A8K9X1Q7_ONCMY
MGSISFWMCLVMTICTWNKTIGCTWMKTLPRSPSMFQVFSNNTITMLQKMGHEVSRGPQITFPDKQYRQVNNFKVRNMHKKCFVLSITLFFLRVD